MNAPVLVAGGAQRQLSRELVIRPAGRDDLELMAAFVASLSLQTRYLRFLSGVCPPASWLRILCGEVGAVVAVIALDDGIMVGHAMAARPAAGGPADVGVVVADSHQGRGVGPALMAELTPLCLEVLGVREITFCVLACNHRALAMIRRCWPQAEWDWSGRAEATVTVLLGPAGNRGRRDGPREPG